MPTMSDRKLEKHKKMLRTMQRLPHNKYCMDCRERGPQYVCPFNFNHFCVHDSSGILREFSFRVKGISMSNFSPAEIKALKAAETKMHESFGWPKEKMSKSLSPATVSTIRKFIKD